MKRFFLFIALLIAVIIFTDRIAAVVLDQVYKNTFTGQTGGKINQYLNASEKFDFLIFGNSRALYQVIPDSIDGRGFNISHAGMGPTFQTGLVSILEQEKMIPQLIVLHLEPYEFNEPEPDATVQNLRYYHGKNDHVTKSLNNLSRFESFKFSLDLYRHNGRIVSLIKNFYQTKTSHVPSNGYDLISPSIRDSTNTIYTFEKLDKSPTEKINPERLLQLEDFIKIVKRNNCHLIAFTSPVYKGLNHYPKTIGVIDSLLASKSIQFLNLNRKDPELTENPRLWKDAYHLNHAGARLFSRVLAKEIRKNDLVPAPF
jgi:hypothetical protein